MSFPKSRNRFLSFLSYRKLAEKSTLRRVEVKKQKAGRGMGCTYFVKIE